MFKIVFSILYVLSFPVNSLTITQYDSFSSPLAEFEIKYLANTVPNTSGQSINLITEISNTSLTDGPSLFFTDFTFPEYGLTGINPYTREDGLIDLGWYKYEFIPENDIFPITIKANETALISLGNIRSLHNVPAGTKLDLEGWASLSSPNSLGVIAIANINITTVPIVPSGVLFLTSSLLIMYTKRRNRSSK